MWADFLSHFTEIGNLDEPVVKQRPNYVPSSQPQANLSQPIHMLVQEQPSSMKVEPVFEKPVPIYNNEGSSGMSMEKNEEHEEEQKKPKEKIPGHNRRISTLDNTNKFTNALDQLNSDVNKTKEAKPKKELNSFVEDMIKEEDEADPEADKPKDPQE